MRRSKAHRTRRLGGSPRTIRITIHNCKHSDYMRLLTCGKHDGPSRAVRGGGGGGGGRSLPISKANKIIRTTPRPTANKVMT